MDVYQVIDTLMLTEKGTRLSEMENKYVFKVHPDANKHQVKEAVEKLFKVRVTEVNTLNRKGKRKRNRMAGYGKTSSWKRAVVALAEDDTIDLT